MQTMIDEPTLAALFDRARSYADDGKYLHAIQLYRQLTTLAPKLDVGWIELAEVYTELKQYDAAEEALLRAREQTSDRHTVTFLLGNLNLKREQYDRAMIFYKELLEDQKALSQRMRPSLLFHIGLVQFYRNNYRSAEEYFRKVLRLDPHFPKIHESLGELLVRRGALAEAVDVLNAAVVNDPYSWIGHYLLGVAYMRLFEWRRAYEEFATAIDMDPNEPNAWQRCGEVLIALHQLDAAEQYLRKALELNPHCVDAVVNFGELYLQRGDYQHARECFETALSYDPTHRKALQGRATLNVVTKLQS